VTPPLLLLCNSVRGADVEHGACVGELKARADV
jgi:hypothetical protein